MRKNLLKFPPLDRLPTDEASELLVNLFEGDFAEVAEGVEEQISTKELRALKSQLQRHHLLTLTNLSSMESGSGYIGWIWHAKLAGGMIYYYDDCSFEPVSVSISKQDSSYLAGRFAYLLKREGLTGMVLESDEVEIASDGITQSDLLRAVVKGISQGNLDVKNPAEAAAAWARGAIERPKNWQ